MAFFQRLNEATKAFFSKPVLRFADHFSKDQYKNEVEKINYYRKMEKMPEIGDVIEDAVDEATQRDDDGEVLHLKIINEKMAKNKNITNNIQKEFDELFNKRLKISEEIWDLFRTYLIDGRVYYERIINESKKSDGIQRIKRLPSETMDFDYDAKTGQILAFYQYLTPNATKPKTAEEAEKKKDVVVFYPDQIGYVNYGVYGRNKKDVEGYLSKAVRPFNQMRMLETSVVIYRIVRAPERLAFYIDTGNMPRNKSVSYVNKVRESLTKKQTYDPELGTLTQEPNVMSMLDNYFIPTSPEGRGSRIETVGGNPAGFSELDDIYYFARKLYKALKYPMSRVSAMHEKRDADILYGGQTQAEITRDEIKWSKFLERHQQRFCENLLETFLLHLKFRGILNQYNITKKDINLWLTPPSNYDEQMEQKTTETRFSNYSMAADREEISRYVMMKKMLKWTDEDIKENAEGLKKDVELGLRQKEEESSGGFGGSFGEEEQEEEPEPKESEQEEEKETEEENK